MGRDVWCRVGGRVWRDILKVWMRLGRGWWWWDGDGDVAGWARGFREEYLLDSVARYAVNLISQVFRVVSAALSSSDCGMEGKCLVFVAAG